MALRTLCWKNGTGNVQNGLWSSVLRGDRSAGLGSQAVGLLVYPLSIAVKCGSQMIIQFIRSCMICLFGAPFLGCVGAVRGHMPHLRVQGAIGPSSPRPKAQKACCNANTVRAYSCRGLTRDSQGDLFSFVVIVQNSICWLMCSCAGLLFRVCCQILSCP
jgi:hypothetical protein